MNEAEVGALWEAQAKLWSDQARIGRDIYRDLVNTPGFLSILPPIAGLTGLDVGCGEGANTRQLAALGAHMQAIDLAPSFVALAREAEPVAGPSIRYQVASATSLPFGEAEFDFATAFMSFMDFPDQRTALREIHRVLKLGGFFQFSILHPCFAPPHRRVIRDAAGYTLAVEVARYYERGDGEIKPFWFSTTPPEERKTLPPFRLAHFHRTLAEWVDMIVASGLTIEALHEPQADAATAAREPVIADTRVVPLFLQMRLRKK